MFLKLLIFMLIFHINTIKSLQYEKSKITSFLGTAELMPNYRRSRIVKEIFNNENSQQQQQQQPENVYEINNDDNIKKKNYDQLISQTQPRKLSDKQQILLDQIVERVARLGGSYLLNNETEIKTNNNNNNGINDTHINNDEIEGRKNKIVKINNDTINYNNNKKIDKQLVTTVKPQKISNKNQSNGNNNNDNIINNENNKINMTENIFSNINTSSIVDSLSLSDHAREDLYNQQFVTSDPIKNKKEPTAASTKPTKYHYYPHNQHIYLLPECAIQQVCNAVYVRLNFTQPLCACPARYRDPCSASINEDDLHTTKLIGDKHRKAITLAKTCESTTEMRECRSPRDWSLLALQNTRTGKSHYLVICRCPDHYRLEGPMAHDQPTYASVPGIRVFGMMCIKPGVTLRRPQIPPKREKPFYQQPQPQQQQQQQYITISPNSQNFQQQQLYKQNQYQNNYQYTHRSDDGSAPITTTENGNIYQDDKITTIQQFNSYGERQNKEEHNINEEDHTEQIQNNRNKRNVKLSSSSTYDSVEDNEISSEISWHKLKKLISDIQWD